MCAASLPGDAVSLTVTCHRAATVVCTLACAILFLFLSVGPAPVAAQEQAEVAAGSTRPVFEGLIEPYRLVHVGAAVSGLLESVTVERGDVVTRGQVLATLESTLERASLAIAAAQAELEAELKHQGAQLSYSTGRFEHDQALFARGLLSEDELELSRREKELAEAGLARAQENQRLAQLEKQRAEASLELRTVKSPIDGVVLEQALSAGEIVGRPASLPILTLAQVDPLRVEVIVPAKRFGAIRPGMDARVTQEILSLEPAVAKVESVDRVLDAASGTFRVRLRLPNPEGALAAGLKCHVEFLELP